MPSDLGSLWGYPGFPSPLGEGSLTVVAAKMGSKTSLVEGLFRVVPMASVGCP